MQAVGQQRTQFHNFAPAPPATLHRSKSNAPLVVGAFKGGHVIWNGTTGGVGRVNVGLHSSRSV